MSSASSQLPSSDLMESLMKDPVKRALVLELLNQEKDNIENYKRQELKTKTTPLKKSKKLYCESPTSLQRRRALEQRKPDTSESSSSDISDVPTEMKGPQLPFELLLKGVTAYVEVKRDNRDRSEGIKAVMKLMGAAIRDKFTNDVTHVIFKDGSFTTFEKAKLMKVHLVSVLWLDAVRRNNARVPEKNYPAFGSRVCDENVSILCSQIQKDYEDIIKDERHRRHTMMTPKTSMTSYLTARNIATSDNETSQKIHSPELTSDDSDCGIVDGHATKRPRDSDILQSSLDVDTQVTKPSRNSPTNLESSDSASLLSRVSRNKRKTISIISDMVLTPNIEPTRTTKSGKTVVTPEKAKNKAKILQNSILQSSTMSSLRLSTESDKTKSDLVNSKASSKTRSSLGGKENSSLKTINSTMSSLRLSESPPKKSKEQRRSRGSEETKKTPPASSTKDEMENTARKGRKSITARTKSVKKTIHHEPVITESEDESSDEKYKSPLKLGSPAKSNTSTPKKVLRRMLDSSESEFEDEVQPKRTETVRRRLTASGDEQISNRNKTPIKNNEITSALLNRTVQDKTPKRNKITSIAKAADLEDKATSDENNDLEPKKADKSKRTRRLTSVTPSSKSGDADTPNKTEVSTRSRRASSVITATSSSGDKNSRRSRRSISKTGSESEMKEKSDNESEFAKPKTVRKLKATSVVLSRSETSSVDLSSVDKSFPKVTVHLPPIDEHPSPTKKNRKAFETTPSSAKKSRVETTSTTKKIRKLYHPDDVTIFLSQEEEDEKERKEHQKQKSQKSPDGVFLNPNNVPITPLSSNRKADISNFDPSEWSSDDNETKGTKRQPRKGKKKASPVTLVRDSSADEQRELLELLDRSMNVEKRRSQRLSLSQTKPKYTFNSRSDSLSSNNLPITPIKRRSTLDFVQSTHTQQQRKLKLDAKRTTSIVCTKMHRQEVTNFEKTVTSLGRFCVEDRVTGKTSHLVAGEAKRTINMLKAIARGCWILKHEWLLKSQETGRWLNEEDYELTEFSPAVQQCRLQREAFGPLYSMDIFKDCGPIYVGKSTTPKPSDLKELISICKGKVTTAYRNAAISVGEVIHKEGVSCVTEMWILESIHFNKLKSFKRYLLQTENQNRSPNF